MKQSIQSRILKIVKGLSEKFIVIKSFSHADE
jgi:hypothetical protein